MKAYASEETLETSTAAAMKPLRRGGGAAGEPVQRTQAAANRTGLPNALKANVEQMSGVSLAGLKVHYNSARPAQLNALAYAQGNEIHLGPGQEQHLPHEAWHVVQQAQNRVPATTQLGGVAINDDRTLESEADHMGSLAATSTVLQAPAEGGAQLRSGALQKMSSPAAKMDGLASQQEEESSEEEDEDEEDELSDEEIEAIDNQAWEAALAATQQLRPDDQVPSKVDKGEDEDGDAITRFDGRDPKKLTVTYYSLNEPYSVTDSAMRLGQMTALFNHELGYHANNEVVARYNTDDENPDDEHFSMFDPDRRGHLLASTYSALEQMEAGTARAAYIDYWRDDILEHIDWDEDQDEETKDEAVQWVATTVGELRRRFLPEAEEDAPEDAPQLEVVQDATPATQLLKKVTVKTPPASYDSPMAIAAHLKELGLFDELSQEKLAFFIDQIKGEQEHFDTPKKFRTFMTNRIEVLQEEADESNGNGDDESEDDELLGQYLGTEEEVREFIERKLKEGHVNKDALSSQVDLYVTRITHVLHGLEDGKFGVRWLSMEINEKREVADRALFSMLSIGTYVSRGGKESLAEVMGDSLGDEESDTEERTAIIHGSYIFGGGQHIPGDMDVILEGTEDAKTAIPLKSTRKMKDEVMTFGTSVNIVDTMVGIPLWGGGDLTQYSPRKLWKEASGPIADYIRAAKTEEDGGKAVRKFNNIAIALDYLFQRIDMKSPLASIVGEANRQIVAGGSGKSSKKTDWGGILKPLAEECDNAFGILAEHKW